MADKTGVDSYLKYQRRFQKMSAEQCLQFQMWVDEDWQRLLNKCRPRSP
jgi:hypothetical protein